MLIVRKNGKFASTSMGNLSGLSRAWVVTLARGIVQQKANALPNAGRSNAGGMIHRAHITLKL